MLHEIDQLFCMYSCDVGVFNYRVIKENKIYYITSLIEENIIDFINKNYDNCEFYKITSLEHFKEVQSNNNYKELSI